MNIEPPDHFWKGHEDIKMEQMKQNFLGKVGDLKTYIESEFLLLSQFLEQQFSSLRNTLGKHMEMVEQNIERVINNIHLGFTREMIGAENTIEKKMEDVPHLVEKVMKIWEKDIHVLEMQVRRQLETQKAKMLGKNVNLRRAITDEVDKLYNRQMGRLKLLQESFLYQAHKKSLDLESELNYSVFRHTMTDFVPSVSQKLVGLNSSHLMVQSISEENILEVYGDIMTKVKEELTESMQRLTQHNRMAVQELLLFEKEVEQMMNGVELVATHYIDEARKNDQNGSESSSSSN